MKRLLLLAFLLTFSFAASAQKLTECFVRGTAVDSSNKPVPNAYIVLDSPPTTWEDLIVFYQSDENGNFSYSTFCPFPDGKRTLYVSSPIPIENYSPFTPPFRTTQLGKRFAGQTIVNKKRGNVDLGNVYVQVYYSTVSIKFVDEAGKPLVDNLNAWKNARIRLHSGKRIVSETGLFRNTYEKALRSGESTITITLPEGDWTIEVNFDGSNWLKPDRILTVQKSNAEIQEILKMSDKKRL